MWVAEESPQNDRGIVCMLVRRAFCFDVPFHFFKEGKHMKETFHISGNDPTSILD